MNAAARGSQVSGHIHALDHGTEQRVLSAGVTQVSDVPDGNGRRIRVRGTCRVDGGDPHPCEVIAVDRGDPGTGDEFHIEVRRNDGTVVYAAGGTLEHGNLKVHT